jgi:hypothetical protein
MCERTCPCCGSKSHFVYYGLSGTCIRCNRCCVGLANRRDYQAAPIDLKTDAEVDAWVQAGSGVLEGAESPDPADDEMFGPNRWPVEGLAF